MSEIILWTEKYKPKNSQEVSGNKTEIDNIIRWINTWFQGVPTKRALMLYGPPGIGKTASIYAIASELGLDIIEVNASDKRNSEEVKRIIGRASQQKSLLNSRIRIILVDEVDGITGHEDKGGIFELIKIVKSTMNPIIMTANDPWIPALRNLRDQCQLIQFKRSRTQSINKILKQISELEGINAEEEALNKIANNANGDIRSAINDLQLFSEGLDVLSEDDVLFTDLRNRNQQIFQSLQQIFKASTIREAKQAFDSTDMDYDLFFKWITENAHLHAKNDQELERVYRILSESDIILSRIRKSNNWKLLRYFIILITGGVSLSITDKIGWKKYQFPTWIRKLGATKSKREIMNTISQKIKNKCHLGTRRAKTDFIPFLKLIFQNNIERANELKNYFELNEQEINLLTDRKEITKKIINFKPKIKQ